MKKATRFISYGFIFSFFMLGLSSCEKDDEKDSNTQLRIEIDTKIAGEDFEINQVYKDYKDRDFRIELFKFYLNNISLVNESGESWLLKDIAIYDAGKSDVLEITIDDASVGTFTHFKAGLGLDEATNNEDPSDYESAHPLSIDNQMYWGWASKFKFVVVEGRVDDGSGSLSSLFAYHSGTNELHRNLEVSLNDFTVESGKTNVLSLNLDVDKMFEGSAGTLDFVDENTSHTTSNFEYVLKMTDNMKAAFYH